ncbi:MAG: hypothetical protein ACSLE5_00075 [Porticoccaceae bacterium]
MEVLHNPPHLNYYKLLERDLDECFRFVEPVESHFEIYSIEFSRIILMAASEIENALKAFDAAANGKTASKGILGYYGVVTSKFPKFCTMQMFLPRCALVFTPWSEWSADKAPDWWTNGYNKIKHNRISNPGAATMRRAIDAVGALQALLHHLYRLKHPDGWIADNAIPEIIIPYESDSATPGASSLWRPNLPDDAAE